MPEPKLPDIEKRVISIEAAELRVERSEKSTKITGYAAVFGKWSVDMGGWREQIASGAFATALGKNPDVRLLYNHEPSGVLGRTKAGTLKLEQNTRGLKISAELPETQLARDLAVSIERGDVDQMSFAFRCTTEGAEWSPDWTERTVKDIDELYDVSIVTYPAYPDTTVAVRSRDAAIAEKTPKPKAKPEAKTVSEMSALELRLEAANKEMIDKLKAEIRKNCRL